MTRLKGEGKAPQWPSWNMRRRKHKRISNRNNQGKVAQVLISNTAATLPNTSTNSRSDRSLISLHTTIQTQHPLSLHVSSLQHISLTIKPSNHLVWISCNSTDNRSLPYAIGDTTGHRHNAEESSSWRQGYLHFDLHMECIWNSTNEKARTPQILRQAFWGPLEAGEVDRHSLATFSVRVEKL
jgi:hypothetical protein